MGEKEEDINHKSGITLSRNTPVALIVGAAGFLGSHLAEKLLDKNIQVIGVDDFSIGKKDYLEDATKNKNFHLLNQPAQDLDIELLRLDYLFIVSGPNWKIDKILEIFKKHKSKVVFVSSIDLYDRNYDHRLSWYKETESRLAKFAHDNHLNARVVRLSAVFGPRMGFENGDSVVRLIQASLLGELQKESLSSEFSSRALFVDDAVNLIIKSMLSGSTALKIFDGALLTPIKVVEIKQVLMDPLWYENRGFNPTELPPWPTPNLEKTVKQLSWEPKVNLVKALRETLSYFKDREVEIPALEIKHQEIEKEDKKLEELPPSEDLNYLKAEYQEKTEEKEKKEGNWRKRGVIFRIDGSKVATIVALAIVFYALVFPFLSVGWGVLNFRSQITQSVESLSRGEFEKAVKGVDQAQTSIDTINFYIASIEPLRKSGYFLDQFEAAERLTALAFLTTDATRNIVYGTENLYKGLQAVTGEIGDNPQDYFSKAQIELAEADNKLSKALADLKEENFKKDVPVFFHNRIDKLKDRLELNLNLVKKGRAASILLPQIIALEGKKSYLVLLQNNNELRPTGGFIGSFAQIDFEGGKLKKLDVNDIYNIDGLLAIHVEPPKEIKEDLGQKDWFLRDSNWEPDFPTSARQAAWFYTKETGQRVEGVIALDVSAVENLLSVLGALDLPDYKEEITDDNLFEKSITHAEQGFFPGSQAKKSFLSSLSAQLFNKIFFLPGQNWPGIVQSLGKSLEQKHLMIYLDNPKLFSYLASQNWTGTMPRAQEDREGSINDFLSVVEANLGANKVNYYIERGYDLETVIGKEGEIKHRLKISYTNRSPSDTWPAGKYKNRMRIYLPFGAKVNRVLWGETNITNQLSTFVDYGRTGYSVLLELQPRESKNLIVDYELGGKIQFKDREADYRLDIIKQAGTLNDPLEWRLTYPINYRLKSSQDSVIGSQEQIISTDLSTDRSFKVTFTR